MHLGPAKMKGIVNAAQLANMYTYHRQVLCHRQDCACCYNAFHQQWVRKVYGAFCCERGCLVCCWTCTSKASPSDVKSSFMLAASTSGHCLRVASSCSARASSTDHERMRYRPMWNAKKRTHMNIMYDGDKHKPVKGLRQLLSRCKQPALLIAAAGLFYITALHIARIRSFARFEVDNKHSHTVFKSPSIAHEQHKILLATHNRLAWYYPVTDAMEVLHQGK